MDLYHLCFDSMDHDHDPTTYATQTHHWPTLYSSLYRYKVHQVMIQYRKGYSPPPFIKLNLTHLDTMTKSPTLSLNQNTPDFRFILMDRGKFRGRWHRYRNDREGVVNTFSTRYGIQVDIYNDRTQPLKDVIRSVIHFSVEKM